MSGTNNFKLHFFLEKRRLVFVSPAMPLPVLGSTQNMDTYSPHPTERTEAEPACMYVKELGCHRDCRFLLSPPQRTEMLTLQLPCEILSSYMIYISNIESKLNYQIFGRGLHARLCELTPLLPKVQKVTGSFV